MSGEKEEIGQARSRLFLLFARLVADGLDPDLIRECAVLPELGDLIDQERDADQEAADHHDLFGFRVPPYAGVFLDETGHVGGRTGDEALAAYVETGMDRIRDDLGPDHLATQLEFLAYCSHRGLEEAARSFIDRQVLSWLPGLVAVVAREPYPAYRGLLPVLEEAVREYRASLGGPATPVKDEPAAEDLLSDPKTGVRDVASFLGTPALSGIWIGRGDVERIGRETGVPRGFGGRLTMLTNLLRSAAEYDQVDPTLSAVDRIASGTAGHWRSAGGPWAGVWIRRIERTRRMLAEIGGRIGDESDQSPES